jgi:hypothetical protein
MKLQLIFTHDDVFDSRVELFNVDTGKQKVFIPFMQAYSFYFEMITGSAKKGEPRQEVEISVDHKSNEYQINVKKCDSQFDARGLLTLYNYEDRYAMTFCWDAI